MSFHTFFIIYLQKHHLTSRNRDDLKFNWVGYLFAKLFRTIKNAQIISTFFYLQNQKMCLILTDLEPLGVGRMLINWFYYRFLAWMGSFHHTLAHQKNAVLVILHLNDINAVHSTLDLSISIYRIHLWIDCIQSRATYI